MVLRGQTEPRIDLASASERVIGVVFIKMLITEWAGPLKLAFTVQAG